MKCIQPSEKEVLEAVKYTIAEIGQLFRQLIEKDCEPELNLRLNDRDYMIIGYKTYVTFQRCGTRENRSGELAFSTLQALYEATTIDNICLARDWGRITEMYCCDFDHMGQY